MIATFTHLAALVWLQLRMIVSYLWAYARNLDAAAWSAVHRRNAVRFRVIAAMSARVAVAASMILLGSLAHAAAFDPAEAKSALARVHVKHCGYGGPGQVRVTFAPTGFVSEAEVYEGHYTDPAIKCIERHFRQPTILAFEGEPVTVRVDIVLPQPPAPPTPSVIHVPELPREVDPKKWRPGDPAPRGYRVEERTRYGLAFGGVIVMLVGGVVVGYSLKSDDDRVPNPGSGVTALWGGAMVLGGAVMTLIGLGTSSVELVPKEKNLSLALGPGSLGATLRF